MTDSLYPTQDYPKVARWEKHLLAIPELPGSVAGDFADTLKSHLKKKAAYTASQLGL